MSDQSKTGPIRRFVRILRAPAGVLLVLLGVAAAYLYFYRFAPYRHLYDPRWAQSHSLEANYEELVRCVERGVWPHEAHCFGTCADKRLLAAALPRLRPGDDISTCSFGHVRDAFVFASNRDEGELADGWIRWWQSHRDRSQEDWIREGFAPYGLHPGRKTTPEDQAALLSLLGQRSTNESQRIPYHVRFNAFRWLRDSGFNSTGYALSNVTASTSVTIPRSLLGYAILEKDKIQENGPGSLWRDGQRDAGGGLPFTATPGFICAAYAFMVVPTTAGLVLLAVAWKQKRRRSDA